MGRQLPTQRQQKISGYCNNASQADLFSVLRLNSSSESVKTHALATFAGITKDVCC